MKSGLLGIAIAIVALVLYWSTFSLNPAQQALVLQFGEVRGVQTTPGLKFKAPWQNVLIIDKRILDLNMLQSSQSLLTKSVFWLMRLRVTGFPIQSASISP